MPAWFNAFFKIKIYKATLRPDCSLVHAKAKQNKQTKQNKKKQPYPKAAAIIGM